MNRAFAAATVLASLVITSIAIAKETKKETRAPAKFQYGVVEDGNLIAIDRDGHLVSQNLMWGSQRDYGNFQRKLLPMVDVARDKACVLTAEEVLEVDLASGNVVRSAKHGAGAAGGLGWIGEDRLFVQNQVTVEIIDLAKQQTPSTIQLFDKKERPERVRPLDSRFSHLLNKNLLYVARMEEEDIAVVDLAQGKVVKVLRPRGYGFVNGLLLKDRKLFVRQIGSSYGILRENLSVIELASGKANRLRFPAHPQAKSVFASHHVHSGLHATSDGGFWLAAHDGVYRYDANGKLVGEANKALDGGAVLLGASEGRPVLSNTKSAIRFKLSTMKVVSNRLGG